MCVVRCSTRLSKHRFNLQNHGPRRFPGLGPADAALPSADQTGLAADRRLRGASPELPTIPPLGAGPTVPQAREPPGATESCADGRLEGREEAEGQSLEGRGSRDARLATHDRDRHIRTAGLNPHLRLAALAAQIRAGGGPTSGGIRGTRASKVRGSRAPGSPRAGNRAAARSTARGTEAAAAGTGGGKRSARAFTD